MPLDFSIPARAFANQFDPAQAQGQAMTMRDMMQRGQMQQQQMDMQRQEFDLRKRGLEREDTRQARLADLLPGAVKGDQAAIDGLAGVDPDMFLKLDERQKAAAKQSAETFAAVGTQLRSLPYEQRRAALMQIAPQIGMTPEQLATFDPTDAAIDTVVAQSLGVKGLLERQDKDWERGFKVAEFGHRRATDADASAARWAGIDVQRYNATKPADGGGQKPPNGYRWAANGIDLVPIKGGPADKANAANLTEGERTAAFLGTRLEGAMRELQTLTGTNKGAAKPGVFAETLRAVGGDTAANLANSSTRQQVEASQLDLLDAALTLGTGAAYTREQLKGYARSYFPQIGDTEKTVAAKQARLGRLVQSARVKAGRAEGQIDTALDRSGSKPPSLIARPAAPPAAGTVIKYDAQGRRIS